MRSFLTSSLILVMGSMMQPPTLGSSQQRTSSLEGTIALIKKHIAVAGGLGNVMFQVSAALNAGADVVDIDTSKWGAGQGEHPDGYLSLVFPKSKKSVVRCTFGGYYITKDAATPKVVDYIHLPDVTRQDSVGVSVRGGDYLNFRNKIRRGSLCDSSYYQRAFQQFPDGTLFEVTTDDRAHAKRVLHGLDYVFAPTSDPVSDMAYLAGHRNLIIANSTFAWWAAMLTEHDTIICPRLWRTDNKVDLHLTKNFTRL